MRAEHAAIRIRARTGWEAIDLGFRMVRRFPRAVYLPWLALVLPVVGIAVFAFPARPFLALLVVLWLRPLLERPVLHVLSRATFGSAVPIRVALGSALDRHTLLQLTFLRIQTARSYTMPVRVLEGLRGSILRNRLRQITANDAGAARWLTFACSIIELVLAGGLLAMVLLFVPDYLMPRADALADGDLPLWFGWLITGAILAALSVSGPLYVAGGFALYTNRRVHLEGWDIDLTFTRLARRLAPLIVLFGVLLGPGPGSDAFADDLQEANKAASRVLEHEDFGHTRKVSRWERRGERRSRERSLADPTTRGVEAGAVGHVLSQLVWVALLLGLLVVVVVVVANWKPQSSGVEPNDGREVDEGAAPLLRVARASLPRDVFGTARRLFERGEAAPALGLLYRAGLWHLVEVRQLEIPESATEGECLAQARMDLPPEQGALFEKLVRTWKDAAFGAREIHPPRFEALCTSVAQLFPISGDGEGFEP